MRWNNACPLFAVALLGLGLAGGCAHTPRTCSRAHAPVVVMIDRTSSQTPYVVAHRSPPAQAGLLPPVSSSPKKVEEPSEATTEQQEPVETASTTPPPAAGRPAELPPPSEPVPVAAPAAEPPPPPEPLPSVALPVAPPPPPPAVEAAPVKPAVAAAPTPAPAVETPIKRKSFVDITADSRFGHSNDYSTLCGQLQYHRSSKAWRLRYASVDEDDPYGGSVTLAEDPRLERCQDGQFVRICGQLSTPTGRAIAPLYQIRTIEELVTAKP
jgi:hypothetical protein